MNSFMIVPKGHVGKCKISSSYEDVRLQLLNILIDINQHTSHTTSTRRFTWSDDTSYVLNHYSFYLLELSSFSLTTKVGNQ